MCGRFAFFADALMLKNRYHIASLPNISPSYNIAPTQNIISILQQDEIVDGKIMRWGLIPNWAKDISIGYKMINARAETIQEKPAFRRSFKTKRCIVPMSGFFEWVVEDGKKMPKFITNEEGLLSVAAIYDTWQDDNSDDKITSCSLLTTNANSFVDAIHNRMPLILTEDNESKWIDQHPLDPALFQNIIEINQSVMLQYYAVTDKMNKPSFNHKSAIEPL